MFDCSEEGSCGCVCLDVKGVPLPTQYYYHRLALAHCLVVVPRHTTRRNLAPRGHRNSGAAE